MEIGILGPLQVVSGDGAVEVAAPMQRALLALLAIHADEVVSTDRILEALWGEKQPSTGVKTLRYHVSKLREALGDDSFGVIVTQPTGYGLSTAVTDVDAFRFRALVADGRALLESNPMQAHDALVEALELWRGPALSEFEHREYARNEARRLEEERIEAVELRIQADLALGRHGEVVPELASLVAEYQYREALRGLLITALYRAGRQAEALQAYQDMRHLLGEELGIDPSPELAALEEQVLLQDESLKAPPLMIHPMGVRSNLPTQLTSFVGRVSELAAVAELVGQARLVTLTGPGGSGKTRLALEAATRITADFRDGVWLVELDRISDPASVPQTIAATLRIQLSGGVDAVETLCGALGTQTMLLVLDNFEHVIEAAPLVSTLLEAAPDLRVLATSRERLRLSGEHLYPVPPLELSDATALFLQEAQAVQPEFALTDEDTGDITAICKDLDALPLAIQLAAARVDVLPPAALRERLSSRLATLTGGSRDRPTRQQSVRNTIEWSYHMLEAQEQRLLASMAVFTGGCSLKAVEAVCPPDLTLDVLDGLRSLTNKSLIDQRSGADAGPRFFLLATIHEYAREILDAEADPKPIRQRHCDYFTELAERAAPRVYAADWDSWSGILNGDLENLLAALAWAFTEGFPPQGCRLLGALYGYWMAEGRLGEVRAWTSDALPHADTLEPLARARLYLVLARAGVHQGFEEARRFSADAFKWSQAAGDHCVTAHAMIGLAMTYVGDRGSYDRAMSLCRQAVDEAQTADAPRLAAIALTALGEVARSHGDDEIAAQAYEEALQISQEVGDKRTSTTVLFNLAYIATHRGDHQTSEHLAAQGLRDAWELNYRLRVAWGLGTVAQAVTAAGKAERGARLLGAADQALVVIGVPREPADQPEYDQARASLEQQLKPAELQALMAEGRAMTLPEAVAFALKEDNT